MEEVKVMTVDDVNKEFDYEEAFSRNLGWLDSKEQLLVENAVIAIPGMGGVGGHHVHALARMGFQRFKIADLDHFEVGNFNRQYGASLSNVGRDKVDVIKELILDINPNCEIEVFPKGVQLDNMDQFLDGVDIVADSLDLYASDLRAPFYSRAAERNIKVVSAGPFGMGTSIMAFDPKKMSFNEYFDLEKEGLSVEAKIIRFLVGMSPTMMHRAYVRLPEAVDLWGKRLPSLHCGVYAASAAMASTILKMVIGRGEVIYAPRGVHVDFYLNKHKIFWRPWGNRNPIQRFLIKVALKMFKAKEFRRKIID